MTEFRFYICVMQTDVKNNKTHSILLNIILPFLTAAIVVLIGFIMLKDRMGSWWPDIAHFRYLDAGWHKNITDNGYVYDPNTVNNTAFFPLFPYVWRWLGVNETGMAIVNALIFSISCTFLFQVFKADIKTKLSFLGLSITVFFVTPFSESFFFLFCTLTLAGVQKKNWLLVTAGVVGACFTRSASTVIFPAFIILAVNEYVQTKHIKDTLPFIAVALLSVVSVLGVFTIQWYQTGEFWAFSNTQKHWGSELRFPDIPFSTWEPKDNGYYDQLALSLGLVSIVYVGYLIISGFRKNKFSADAPTLFALLYFAGIATLMLFTRGGGYNSINRYTFCTPFFFLFMRHIRTFPFTKGQLIFLLLLNVTYYLVCWHMGTTAERVLVAEALLAFSFLLPFSIRRNDIWSNLLFFLFFASLIIVQANLWFRYVTGIWVG